MDFRKIFPKFPVILFSKEDSANVNQKVLAGQFCDFLFHENFIMQPVIGLFEKIAAF